MEPLRIVILEDELIVVKDLSKRLKQLGYEVVANFAEGEALIGYLSKQSADLLLVDIQLKGQLDGIETVRALKNLSKAPVVFITAQADQNTFNEAKEVKPAAYLIKPYNNFDLQTTIELAIENHAGGEEESEVPFIVDEKIFVRGKHRFERVELKDIQYLEAAGNYTNIVTSQNKYVVTTKLGHVEHQLQEAFFFRCHRSFMVNLKKVDGFDDANVYIDERKIPISKGSKKAFLDRLRVI